MADYAAIYERLAQLYPHYRVQRTRSLGPDDDAAARGTAKAAGYGKPIAIDLAGPDGDELSVVWHVAGGDGYGHDRRADRAAAALLAYDDFAKVPQHARAIDVGAVCNTGKLLSLGAAGELYLITEYAKGTPYAHDLRRIALSGATPADLRRVDALTDYLAALHVPISDPVAYRRAIRDLIGHGEGVYGMVDGYDGDVPGATLDRIYAIEQRCATWRQRLREHEGRLTRTHGDFHPFNVLFDGDALVLLDASRGACGDPVDDVTAMAINFILFALDQPGAWRHLGPLWHRFWSGYEERGRADPSLRAVAPPFFAWRALVVCNPKFYPNLSPAGRSALLGLAEGALEAKHLDPAWADDVFR